LIHCGAVAGVLEAPDRVDRCGEGHAVAGIVAAFSGLMSVRGPSAALLDVDQHALGVDVGRFKPHDLRAAQPAP
jgi:hypothetical protein